MRIRLPAILLLLMLANLVAGAVPKRAVSPPEVETRVASALGTTGVTVNGSIHPHGLPTTYYFEYGPTSDYGSRTTSESLPPRLASF